MTDKASLKGWVVRVTTKRLSGGQPCIEIFDAAIVDPEEAAEAVMKANNAGPDTVVEVIEELHATDLDSGMVRSRFARMTDKASLKGWVVRVTTKRLSGGQPCIEIFDAAIVDPEEAAEAVMKASRAGPDTVVQVIEELYATDLDRGTVRSR